jgi:alpha-glucosidase
VDESAKPAPPPLPQQPPPGVYLPYVPYVPPPRPVKKVAPPPPADDPLTIFYAKLATLHHTNAALRTGSKTVLDFDAQNILAWIARPASPTPQNPPVVVLVNLSAQPVELSLADAMKKLNLHGFFLRKLLRSDDAMGAEDIAAVKLAPYSVFIGELRR